MADCDLIVGGTGMLAGVTKSLLASGREVTVLSRGKVSVDGLAVGGNRARHLKIDYSNQRLLDEALASRNAEHGPFERSICWVHSAYQQEVCSFVATRTNGIFVHVMGSSAKDPAHPDHISLWRDRFQRQYPALDYRIVVLGFAQGKGRPTRWLTHAEISAGVLESLATGAPVRIVGTVEPWTDRP